MSKAEVRARVNCARAISILSHWLDHQRLNYTTGRLLSKQREEPVHPGGFMYLLPPIPNVEDYSGSDRAVTTYRLPLQTMGIVDIQQLLANLITLEQTYEYWSS